MFVVLDIGFQQLAFSFQEEIFFYYYYSHYFHARYIKNWGPLVWQAWCTPLYITYTTLDIISLHIFLVISMLLSLIKIINIFYSIYVCKKNAQYICWLIVLLGIRWLDLKFKFRLSRTFCILVKTWMNTSTDNRNWNRAKYT